MIKYDRRISGIRLVAFAFIVTCHIQQYLNIELAWWFNVGVQMFLCISGFLYGQKRVGDVVDFYKRRFIKILVPYYMVLLFMTLLQIIFIREIFSITRFIAAMVCRTTIKGGEHLWFVAIILMCYVMTPLIELYTSRFVNCKGRLIFVSICVCGIVSIFFGAFAQYFNPAWMTCYVIGYMLGINSGKGYIEEKKLLVFFSAFAVIGNGIQIFFDYIKCVNFTGLIGKVYSYWCNYNHAILGVFIFLLLRQLLSYIDFSKRLTLNKFLDVSDQYSYEAYLVHQFVIMGPFSLMAVTEWGGVNIIIVLTFIVLFTVLLKNMEEKVLSLIP